MNFPGKNWARDRHWQSDAISPSVTGAVDPTTGREVADYGLFEGLLAKMYGFNPQEEANLALEKRKDTAAEAYARNTLKLSPGELLKVGVDISKPNNTIDQMNTASTALTKLYKEEDETKVTAKEDKLRRQLLQDRGTLRKQGLADAATLRTQQQEDRDFAAMQRQLEAQQANLQALKVLGLQNEASQTQWLRQMEYMDRKDQALKEEKQLETLIAGLAALGANLAF